MMDKISGNRSVVRREIDASATGNLGQKFKRGTSELLQMEQQLASQAAIEDVR